MRRGQWAEHFQLESGGRLGRALPALVPPVLRAATRLAGALPDCRRDAVQRALGWAARRALRVRLGVAGFHHLPREPGLILSLHGGFMDVPALLALPRPLTFVARDEIFDWDDLGPLLAALDHVRLSPEDGARDYRRLLGQVRARLAAGRHVVVFGQGTLLGIETAVRPGASVWPTGPARPAGQPAGAADRWTRGPAGR